jgi:hypothetical protein
MIFTEEGQSILLEVAVLRVLSSCNRSSVQLRASLQHLFGVVLLAPLGSLRSGIHNTLSCMRMKSPGSIRAYGIFKTRYDLYRRFLLSFGSLPVIARLVYNSHTVFIGDNYATNTSLHPPEELKSACMVCNTITGQENIESGNCAISLAAQTLLEDAKNMQRRRIEDAWKAPSAVGFHESKPSRPLSDKVTDRTSNRRRLTRI